MRKHYSLVLALCAFTALAGCIPPQDPYKKPEVRSAAQRQQQTSSQTDYNRGTGTQGAKEVVAPAPIGFTETDDLQNGDIIEKSFTPSMSYINDRIYEYGRKLDRWKALDEQAANMEVDQKKADEMVQCFRDLQQALSGYTQLREELLQQNSMNRNDGVSGERFLELQQRDIQFLESSCGRIVGSPEEKGTGWHEREETADLPQLETLIDRYAENGEYEEVVQVWMQIPDAQKDRVDLKSRISYGNALMFLHQEEKAAEVYQGVVDDMSASKKQSTDLISLRKVLADIYTAAGNYTEAEKQYGKISDDYTTLGNIEEWSKLQLYILSQSAKGSPELKEYSTLLRNYLGFIPKQDGYKIVWQADDFLKNYPYTAVSSNVDKIKSDALQRADDWFNTFLASVDQLVTEKKYEEALEMLDTIPADILGNEKLVVLKKKTDDLVLEEAVNRETENLAKMQDLQRKWNSGILMMENGNYEDAIGVFIGLLDTEYSTKASEKIEEVSLLAAKAERRKAANIFSRFTKTNDIESKKALLIECRKVLRDIMIKYPDVEIADKVVGNIKRVEQEMNLLDPTMLPAIEQAEAQHKEVKAEFDPMAAPSADPFDMASPATTPAPTPAAPGKITEEQLYDQ